MCKGDVRARLWPYVVLASITLASVALGCPTVVAAEGTIEVLQVGWGGVVVQDTWSPVRVRVTGGGADATARIEVILKNRYQTGPQSTTVEFPIGAYGQEVALPAGVAKDMTVWVPATGNMPGVVQLSVGGRVVAEQAVEFRAGHTPVWPLVGVLAESPAVARAVGQVELPYQGLPVPVTAAGLVASDLPSTAERMSALSALVVQGKAAVGLTGEQRRAIQEWVAAGGDLVLAGGPDGPRAAAALPNGALLLTFTGADGAADLTALTRWAEVEAGAPWAGPVSRFRAEVGAPLAGTVEAPLAWRLGLGQGTVTILAVDPTLEPLQSWSGTPALLRKALEPALPSPGEDEKMRYISMQQGRDSVTRLQGTVEALPAEAFPPWQTIALVMGGFALLVGPVLHLGLRRANRREWVWLAVPALAILASGALYYVGVGREGRDVLANVMAYVRLSPDGGPSRQLLAVGFYGPTHEDLVVSAAGDLSPRVNVPIPGPYGGAAVEPPYRVLGGRDTRVEFAAGQWAMRSLAFGRTLGDETGHITASLGLAEGLIKGTVRNDTPYPLEDAAVVVGQTVLKLGDLAPGQVAQVVLDPQTIDSTYMYGGGFPLSYRLFGRPVGTGASGSSSMVVARPALAPAVIKAPAVPLPAQTTAGATAQAAGATATPSPAATTVAAAATAARPAATRTPTPALGPKAIPAPSRIYEPLEVPRDPEVQRRVRLMDSSLSATMAMASKYGSGSQAMPLTFLAFTRAPVGGEVPRAGNHPVYHLTLLEQSLRLELSPGPFALPAILTPAEVLMQTGGGGGGSDGTVQWSEVQSGFITYGFRPLLPEKADVEALVVSARQLGPSFSTADMSRGVPPPPGGAKAIGPAESGVFSVYNWQAAIWDPLPVGEEQVALQPGPYLAADGQVQMRVKAESGRAVRFLQPELTVEGRVAE